MTDVTIFASRKSEVRRESGSIFRKVHQRTRSKAESLSRLARAKASAELVNEALAAVIWLAYEALASGEPVNVDPATGDLLIAAPWSSRNYDAYGLRRSEGDVLRRYLLEIQRRAAKGRLSHPPLFAFDEVSRRWTLNRADYPTFEDAEGWLDKFQLTPEAWLKWMQHVRKQRRKWRKKEGAILRNV